MTASPPRCRSCGSTDPLTHMRCLRPDCFDGRDFPENWPPPQPDDGAGGGEWGLVALLLAVLVPLAGWGGWLLGHLRP